MKGAFAMEDNAKQIDTFLESRLDGYIAETAQLCAQPSVSAKHEGMAECAQLVAAILKRHGFEVRQFETPGNPIIVGTAKGRSERTMLFYNHYDVQPPEPLELWTSPPFQPEVRDGALYARGSKDDKGEFIARLAAVDAVRAAHGGELPCGVTFVVEGEEEISSPHIAQFVQEHLDLLKSHGSIWEEGGINNEGRPTNTLGRRGILAVELQAQTLRRDAHSGGAHLLPNAAWRLIRALSILKGADERVLVPGFYDRALPPSPLDEQLFADSPSDEDSQRAEFGISELGERRFVRDATGAAYKRAVFEPTCNIAGIWGGYQGQGMKTVIPAIATAKVDFRLVPDQDPKVIFDALRAYLDDQGFSDIKLTWLGAMWPSKGSADDPLVLLTARTGEEVYGKSSVLTPLTGGSSPVYAFARPLGITVVSPGVGYPGSRTHAPDEHLRLSDFLNGARHIARILDKFADLPSTRG
jgi:acetylornithine deacetylase/succinyl-diaminopimelate desuccinylase-like protein